MYVAVANSTGTLAVVYHEAPSATQIDIWTEWRIDLQAFADQGVGLADVNKFAIGFGTKFGAGGNGKMYFDDIRLCPPLSVGEVMDGEIDFSAVEAMGEEWLSSGVQ
jgi:hypothetical protein